MRDRTKKTRDLSHEHLAEAGQAQLSGNTMHGPTKSKIAGLPGWGGSDILAALIALQEGGPTLDPVGRSCERGERLGHCDRRSWQSGARGDSRTENCGGAP
jgi:hypothetical protein